MFLTLLSCLLESDPRHRFGPDQTLNHTFFDAISNNDTNLQLKSGSAKSKCLGMDARSEQFLNIPAFDRLRSDS